MRTSKVQVQDTEAEKIFTVQIGVYMTEKEKGLVKDFWSIPSKLGTYIYYSGKFNTSNEAVLHLNDLVLKGYKNAFITTQNKKKMSKLQVKIQESNYSQSFRNEAK